MYWCDFFQKTTLAKQNFELRFSTNEKNPSKYIFFLEFSLELEEKLSFFVVFESNYYFARKVANKIVYLN